MAGCTSGCGGTLRVRRESDQELQPGRRVSRSQQAFRYMPTSTHWPMTTGNRSSNSKRLKQRRERRDAFPSAVPKPNKRAIGRSTTQETPLHVRGVGFRLDDSLRAYIQSRVGFKLGKYALVLTRISVRIQNVAGPKGAPMYACRFKVVVPNTPQTTLTATERTPRSAFDSAADATERAVRRLVGRRQLSRRRSERSPSPA